MDYTMLADLLRGRFPKGVAVLHLSRGCCIVNRPGYLPHSTELGKALEWLRNMDGHAVGLAIQKEAEELRGAVINIGRNNDTHRRTFCTRLKLIAQAIRCLIAFKLEQLCYQKLRLPCRSEGDSILRLSDA